MAKLIDKYKSFTTQWQNKIDKIVPKEFLIENTNNFHYDGENKIYTYKELNKELINLHNYEIIRDLDVKKIVKMYKELIILLKELDNSIKDLNLDDKDVHFVYYEIDQYKVREFVDKIEWTLKYNDSDIVDMFLIELKKEGYLKEMFKNNNISNYFANACIPNFIKNNTNVKNIYKDYGIAEKIESRYGTRNVYEEEKTKNNTKEYNNFVLNSIEKEDLESIEKLRNNCSDIRILLEDEKNSQKLKELLEGKKIKIENGDSFFYGINFLEKLSLVINGDTKLYNLFKNKEEIKDYLNKYSGKIPIDKISEMKDFFNLSEEEIINIKSFLIGHLNIQEIINIIKQKGVKYLFNDNVEKKKEFLSFVFRSSSLVLLDFLKKQNKEDFVFNKIMFEITDGIGLLDLKGLLKDKYFDIYINNKLENETSIKDFTVLVEELLNVKEEVGRWLDLGGILKNSYKEISEKKAKGEKEDVVSKEKIIKEKFEAFISKQKFDIEKINNDLTIEEMNVLFENYTYKELEEMLIKSPDDKNRLVLELIKLNRRNTAVNYLEYQKLYFYIKGFIINFINNNGVNKIDEEDVFKEFEINLENIEENTKVEISDLPEKLLKELMVGVSIDDIKKIKEIKQKQENNTSIINVKAKK
jgi:hypothetical protein